MNLNMTNFGKKLLVGQLLARKVISSTSAVEDLLSYALDTIDSATENRYAGRSKSTTPRQRGRDKSFYKNLRVKK